MLLIYVICTLTSVLSVGVNGEDMIDGPDDLVHALDVALPRVELGIQEQHPFHYLPVCLAALVQRRVITAMTGALTRCVQLLI